MSPFAFVVSYLALAIVIVSPPLWIPAIIVVFLLRRRAAARDRAYLARVGDGWSLADQERFKAAQRALS